MKTDKEFLDGIYKKYNEHTKENKKIKKNYFNKIINVAAIFIVGLSVMFLLSEKQEKTHINDNGKIEELKSNLKTVGSFENFCYTIKANTDISRYTDKFNNVQEASKADSSQTNTQVQNVDEADIVKVHKNNIFYVAGKKVVILNAANSENSSKIAEINYEQEEFYPTEIYVNDEKLVVIGNVNNSMTCKTIIGDTTRDIVQITENKINMIIYDIRDKKEPKEERRIEVEGNYLTSRMIDNNIYLVSNKNIYAKNILEKSTQELNEKEYMPKYKDTIVSEDINYIDYNKISCFENTNNTNYLILVGLNLESKEEVNIQTFLGAGEYIYSSEKNMYIAVSNIEYDEEYRIKNSSTDILKYELSNGNYIFKAETQIDGIINNQFSMDENDKFFRIATTVGDPFNVTKETSNNLYILNDKLEVVGKIDKIAPDEKIYSVRYVKDKAYIVTFKQTDPLFVIDLSNPSNPVILGEVKLPGYSTYLHPYDDIHIIGFGYDTKENGKRVINNGLKMVMFDISDYTSPKVLFEAKVADKNSYTSLTYNHKSLLYSKDKNIIGFPITTYSNGKTNSKAQIYKIDLEKGFILQGEIIHNSKNFDEEIKRVVFSNNAYYTLSNKMVKVVDMDNLQLIKEIEI